MAAGAAAVIVTKTEAVRRTHGIITGQVVHAGYLTLPGGEGCGARGGGQGEAKGAAKWGKKKVKVWQI